MKSLIASLAAAVLAASIMSVSIFAPVASATVKPKPPGIGSTIKVAAIPGASGAYSVTVLQVYFELHIRPCTLQADRERPDLCKG